MKMSCCLAVAFFTVLLPALVLAYEVPNEREIKRPDKNPPLAEWVGPVKFPHGKHAVHNPCKSCHHEESDRDLGAYLPCTQCHNKPGTEESPSTAFFRAWHSDSTQSCIGCHRKQHLDGNLTPPVSCINGCHKKQ